MLRRRNSASELNSAADCMSLLRLTIFKLVAGRSGVIPERCARQCRALIPPHCMAIILAGRDVYISQRKAHMLGSRRYACSGVI